MFVLSLGLGDYSLNPSEVLRILFVRASQVEFHIIFGWRMPRAIAGIAVGCALGLAGAITQSIARNPLASPDVLGITSGASAFAVTVIGFAGFGGVATAAAGFGVPLAALTGAGLTSIVVYFLAWRKHSDPFRLVLTGVIITALFQAYIHWLITSAEIRDAAQAQFWLTGSLSGATWLRTIPVVVLVLAFIPMIPALSFKLKPLPLTDDAASSLGTELARSRLVLLATAIVLAAMAVAAAGPIGFVSFVAPQLALRLAGTATPPLTASMLTGAVLLTGADLFSRTVLPAELPVGLVTAAFGGIFLIALLIKLNRRPG
nr:iron chelate uptake ABC transporter family permease subunit [Corynebacterium sp. TAE3-ERU12]